MAFPAAAGSPPGSDNAESPVAPGHRFGLYAADRSRLADGTCRDCPTSRQALWYFERETIAVPVAGTPVAAHAPGVRADGDVRAWAATRVPDAPVDYPPLVWVAAPQVAASARLASDATALTFSDGVEVPFSLAPKHPLNRSWFDGSSAQFFAQRTIKLRGVRSGEGFVARTLWPEDFRFGPALPPPAGIAAAPTAGTLRALVRAEPRGGAQSPYAAATLWRHAGSAPNAPLAPGRAVIGLMLNGAQGDDDEAHGGHFAIATGRIESDGAIGDWLVNNFYSLDVESEKGIIAAPTPLDNYLADLNAGQGWYRPSYMLVAVLRDDRAATLLQSALNRVYNQFWRHQLVYDHATMNCAGISVDVLRALGWEVPARGPTSRLLGALAFPWFVASEPSLAKAMTAVDYLAGDQTRLLPAAAFEVAGESLLALVGGLGATGDAGARGATGDAGPRGDSGAAGEERPRDGAEGRLARLLAEDVEMIAFLRFPQFPSSRAFGNAPAVSTWEYRSLVPADPAEAQIVVVPARPFPDALRDPDLLPAPRRPSDFIALAWSLLAAGAIALIARWVWRR